MIRTTRIVPMFPTYLEPTIPRKDAYFQIGCLLIRKSQLLKSLRQCNTVKSTNMQGMVLRNTAIRNLIAGEAQAVEEA
jgi:hypothetical protein